MKCPHCNGTGEVAIPTFSNLIFSRRTEMGWTQLQLAEAVGCTRAHIANIELGRRDCPLNTLQRIAKALGVSAKDLIP